MCFYKQNKKVFQKLISFLGLYGDYLHTKALGLVTE